jgi:hypothetical protein
MDKGDKIVCINDSKLNNFGGYITYKHIYEIISVSEGVYYIKDDNDKEYGFIAKRFISLADWRDYRINQILDI